MITRAPTDGQSTSERRAPGAPVLAAVLLMRPVQIVLGTVVTYGVVVGFTDRPDAWSYAQDLGNVHTVLLADVVTIAVIARLVRREGLRLRDLVGIVRGRVLRDVGLGLGIGVLLYAAFVVASFAGGAAAVGLFGPAAQAAAPGATLALPLWYGLWSLLVLPVTVAIAEELLYRGWAQPRVQAIIGTPALAVVLVGLAFGVQHIAFDLSGPAGAVARFVTTFLVGIVFGVLYLWLRRLLPLIVGHWLVDVIGLGVPALLLSLGAVR